MVTQDPKHSNPAAERRRTGNAATVDKRDLSDDLHVKLKAFVELSNHTSNNSLRQFEDLKRACRDGGLGDIAELLPPDTMGRIIDMKTLSAKTTKSIQLLAAGDWRFDAARILQEFGWDVLGSVRFLDALVKVSHTASWDKARPLLHKNRSIRRESHGDGRYKGVSLSAQWQPTDVTATLAELNANAKGGSSKRSQCSTSTSAQLEPVFHLFLHPYHAIVSSCCVIANRFESSHPNVALSPVLENPPRPPKSSTQMLQTRHLELVTDHPPVTMLLMRLLFSKKYTTRPHTRRRGHSRAKQ